MKYFRSKEAAKHYNVHPNTLRKWADLGKVKFKREKNGNRFYEVEKNIQKIEYTNVVCLIQPMNKLKEKKHVIEYHRRYDDCAFIIEESLEEALCILYKNIKNFKKVYFMFTKENMELQKEAKWVLNRFGIEYEIMFSETLGSCET